VPQICPKKYFCLVSLTDYKLLWSHLTDGVLCTQTHLDGPIPNPKNSTKYLQVYDRHFRKYSESAAA